MVKSMAGIILILIALILLFSSTITNIVNNSRSLWWWQSLNKNSSSYSYNVANSSNNFAASISATIGAGSAIAIGIAGLALIWIDFNKKHPRGGHHINYDY
jgi:ABC-type Fe3+ transport system permease subunit